MSRIDWSDLPIGPLLVGMLTVVVLVTFILAFAIAGDGGSEVVLTTPTATAPAATSTAPAGSPTAMVMPTTGTASPTATPARTATAAPTVTPTAMPAGG